MADDVVIDTSTLINFLRIDRFDILARLSKYRFLATDHVRAEVTSHYVAQLARLEAALNSGELVEITLVTSAELSAFAAMQSLRVLGSGECSAIAAASVEMRPLAIDDFPARKKALAFNPTLRLLDTVKLMVEAIQGGILTVAEADVIKEKWAKNHRFRKSHFGSFADLLP
jgi:predicted nucleic acid-binding protein